MPSRIILLIGIALVVALFVLMNPLAENGGPCIYNVSNDFEYNVRSIDSPHIVGKEYVVDVESTSPGRWIEYKGVPIYVVDFTDEDELIGIALRSIANASRGNGFLIGVVLLDKDYIVLNIIYAEIQTYDEPRSIDIVFTEGGGTRDTSITFNGNISIGVYTQVFRIRKMPINYQISFGYKNGHLTEYVIPMTTEHKGELPLKSLLTPTPTFISGAVVDETVEQDTIRYRYMDRGDVCWTSTYMEVYSLLYLDSLNIDLYLGLEETVNIRLLIENS